MKTFAFWNLRSHGELEHASTRNLLPSIAIVRAGSLGDARGYLRAVGLTGKSYRHATAVEVGLVAPYRHGTVAWTTADMDSDEWVVGRTVDEYVREHL